MSDLIGSSNPLSDEHKNVLRKIAGLLIPPSDENNLPGADDDNIFANALVLAQSNATEITRSLDALEARANAREGSSFIGLDLDAQTAVLEDIFGLLEPVVRRITSAYYQDARVLESINLKSTPPFPGGHEVEVGDWSLLDPVKARAPFYRKV